MSVANLVFMCQSVTLPFCSLLTPQTEPPCYSRNIEINNLLLFQPATLMIHIISLIMTTIMIFSIKRKYTAVGRREILQFFYLYFSMICINFLLFSGLVPIASQVYKYFTALQIGVGVASAWCLLVNGFVGFQWAEDGTPTSLWSIRLSSLLVGVVGFVIATGTFINIGVLSNSTPVALFIVYFVFTTACVIIYVICQIVLVLNTLDDRWPLGDILFGFFFFVLSQMFMYVISTNVCVLASHYIDGLFFGEIFGLLAVMMVYKYWDSITKEDLEFSVGSKSMVWDSSNNQPLLNDSDYNR